MIVLIDNYDSFVHNLARYLRLLGADTEVIRNDACTVEDVLVRHDVDGIVLSPGPCTPDEAGICLDLVKAGAARIPILGVCLGHQVIGQAYGARIRRGVIPVHGKASVLYHDCRGIFSDLPSPMEVGRYHSLVVDMAASGPLVRTAYCVEPDGSRTTMAVAHRSYPHVGVQFHPESILTANGSGLLRNFLTLVQQWQASRAAMKNAAQ